MGEKVAGQSIGLLQFRLHECRLMHVSGDR